MNAKWLEKFVKYRESENALSFAKIIVGQKILYQFKIVKKEKESTIFLFKVEKAKDIKELLLIEARAAKKYWQYFGQKIEKKSFWFLVKRTLDVKFYNKELGYCITLEYWIRLNASKIMHFVNINEAPLFIFPSLRNENRCKKPSPSRR